MRLDPAANPQLTAGRARDDNAAVLDRQRMAERYEFRGPFDRLHAGDNCGIKNRALGTAMPAGAQRAGNRGRQYDTRFSFGDSVRNRLVYHRDHGRTK